jgi:small subunit ribosomal protein S8
VLATEGFVKDCTVLEAGAKRDIRIWLRYDSAQRPVITGLRRISRPSRRVYVGSRSMPIIRGGMGINILSTPEGVMVDREAVRRKVGGEVLCAVW